MPTSHSALPSMMSAPARSSQEGNVASLRSEINLLAVKMNKIQERIVKIKKKSAREQDLQTILSYNRDVRKLKRKAKAYEQEHAEKLVLLVSSRQAQFTQQISAPPKDVLLPDQFYPEPTQNRPTAA